MPTPPKPTLHSTLGTVPSVAPWRARFFSRHLAQRSRLCHTKPVIGPSDGINNLPKEWEMLPKLRWPSPAFVVAIIAVVLALAGTAFGVSANLGQGVRITSQDLRITVGSTGTRTLIASNEFGRLTVNAADCVDGGATYGAVTYLNDTDHEVQVMIGPSRAGETILSGQSLGNLSVDGVVLTALLKTGTGANVSVAEVTIGFVRVTDSGGNLVACDFVAQRTQL